MPTLESGPVWTSGHFWLTRLSPAYADLVEKDGWWGRTKPRGSRALAGTPAGAQELPLAVRRLASETC